MLGMIILTMDHDAAIVAFERLWSAISERCWSASRMYGIETQLPQLCEVALASGIPVEYGQSEVSVPEARALTALAGALGGWATAFKECP